MEWFPYILPALSNLILVSLGVIMSLPKLAEAIEDSPRYRKCLGAICLAAGLIGFIFDVGQRHSSDVSFRQLLTDMDAEVNGTSNLITKTDVLVASTDQMVNSLGLIQPQLSAYNDHLAAIDRKIEYAEQVKDIASLNGLQAEKQASLDALLLMTPGITGMMRQEYKRCDHDDIHFEELLSSPAGPKEGLLSAREIGRAHCADGLRSLMISANHIREELLHRARAHVETPEDRKAAAIFLSAVAGNGISYLDLPFIAKYLDDLARQFGTNAPPNLRVAIQ